MDPRFGTNVQNGRESSNPACIIGQILLSAAQNVNAGGIPCDGRLLQISQNVPLFALIGTTYGGDGITTYAVPDMRSITPNNMTYSICELGIFPSAN